MSLPSQKWLAFYQHQGADHRQRSLVDIWTMTFDELEKDTDFINWLFPLPDPTSSTPEAPVLSAEIIIKVYQYSEVQRNLLRSFDTMAAFWGFTRNDDNTISRSDHFAEQSKKWCCRHNHNQQRISRMLSCLTLTGHAQLAANTCEFLLAEVDHAGHSFSEIAEIPEWISAVEPGEELEITMDDFETESDTP